MIIAVRVFYYVLLMIHYQESQHLKITSKKILIEILKDMVYMLHQVK